MEKLSNPRIAIIGGGITGLAASWQLNQQVPSAQLTLFEAQAELGGVLKTQVRDGFLIEHSADMFLAEPDDAVRLCEEIGMGDELIAPNPNHRYSYVVCKGKLQQIPSGFALMAPAKIWPVLKSPILSWRGKCRLLSEWFLRPQPAIEDESLKSFAVRHFGSEVFKRLIQPLITGIYSADADQLSIQATLDRFVKMESEYGSLIRAGRAKQNKQVADEESAGARYGLFLAPRNGFQSLVDGIVVQLSEVCLRTGNPVNSIASDRSCWKISAAGKSDEFDAVILATSAKVAAKLTVDVENKAQNDDTLSEQLGAFCFGSLIVIAISCCEDNFQNGLPKGFGFVVPEVEERDIIACSFSSNKFVGRAPEGKFLMRCFLGGTKVSQWINRSDDELIATATRELEAIIGFQPNNQTAFQVFRWSDCMPQYRVGHLDQVSKLDQTIERIDGLELAGSSYDGVGVPACIQSGQSAADRVKRWLNCRYNL